MQHSWTGSETERRPQGVCLPPSKPSDLREKWTLPVGTPVLIQPVNDCKVPYRRHTLKMELGFRKCEDYSKGIGRFRHDGYFIKVEWKHVIKRE